MAKHNVVIDDTAVKIMTNWLQELLDWNGPLGAASWMKLNEVEAMADVMRQLEEILEKTQ